MRISDWSSYVCSSDLKLLRVVEYGEFERVGSSETIKVNIRLIGAANVDLPSMARAGKFREDLLDRLSFDVITVPPLRERRDDIILLAQKFAEGMAKELGREYLDRKSTRLNSSH